MRPTQCFAFASLLFIDIVGGVDGSEPKLKPCTGFFLRSMSPRSGDERSGRNGTKMGCWRRVDGPDDPGLLARRGLGAWTVVWDEGGDEEGDTGAAADGTSIDGVGMGAG